MSKGIKTETTQNFYATHEGYNPFVTCFDIVSCKSSKDKDGAKDQQVLYNVDTKKIVGQLGNPEIFPKPEGDVSLSPDGKWFANGYGKSSENFYSIYRLSDGAYVRSAGISKGSYSGDIRIDPAPRWNRTNDAILVPGIDKNGTRQMFVIKVDAK